MEPPFEEMTEEKLAELFERNYDALRLEGGHQLAPEPKNAALQQVLLYWRKLKTLAEKVTETEVRLTLPKQTTKQGRTFGIEGVVDIVREADRVTMYDLKTHDADYINANIDLYAPQLNVYAHIWQGLRQQDLDETAIISTVLPYMLRDALNKGDAARATREMDRWEPLIPVPFDQDEVEETIAKFGLVVDLIEDRKFAPPAVEKLKAIHLGVSQTFATQVCRNCDARFSCSSYRAFALHSGSASARTFREYFQANVTDDERDNWITAGLQSDGTRTPDDFGV